MQAGGGTRERLQRTPCPAVARMKGLARCTPGAAASPECFSRDVKGRGRAKIAGGAPRRTRAGGEPRSDVAVDEKSVP